MAITKQETSLTNRTPSVLLKELRQERDPRWKILEKAYANNMTKDRPRALYNIDSQDKLAAIMTLTASLWLRPLYRYMQRDVLRRYDKEGRRIGHLQHMLSTKYVLPENDRKIEKIVSVLEKTRRVSPSKYEDTKKALLSPYRVNNQEYAELGGKLVGKIEKRKFLANDKKAQYLLDTQTKGTALAGGFAGLAVLSLALLPPAFVVFGALSAATLGITALLPTFHVARRHFAEKKHVNKAENFARKNVSDRLALYQPEVSSRGR